MTVRRGLLVLLLLLSLLALTGCDLLMKSAVEKATGVKVDQNKVTVTGKNGEQAVVSGEEGKLPAGLPQYVPVHSGKILGKSAAMETAQGSTYTFVVQTDEDIATAVAWAKQVLLEKGWTITTNVTTSDSAVVSAKMGEKTQLTMTVKKDAGTATEIMTMVNITK